MYQELIERRLINSKVHFYTVEIGSSLGHMSENSKMSLYQFYQMTTKSASWEQVLENVINLAKLGSYKIFKHRYENRWDRRMRYLQPAESSFLWTTFNRRKRYRRRGIVRGYIVPLLKLFAAMILVSFPHVSTLSLFLNYWHLPGPFMTFKVTVFCIMGVLICLLQLFRP